MRKRTMDGFVTLAEESRFQLTDRDGISHHFVLAHGASAEPSQLGPLQRGQSAVRVIYTKAANAMVNVAHKIELRAP